jgi:HEAT repeat protein
MTPADAERFARRIHRYELDESGGPFVEHLERVAALVAEDGGPRERMAAWLHGTLATGIRPCDLAIHGVPPAVIRIIAAVTPGQRPRPWHRQHAWISERAARVRSCPGAPLVLRAVISDRYRPGALVNGYQAWMDAELLTWADIPLPGGLPAERTRGSRPDVTSLLAQLTPDSPGRWEAARKLADAGEPTAILPLVSAYLAAKAGDPRWDGPALRGRGHYELATWLDHAINRPARPGDPALAVALLEMAAHPDEDVRARAVRGLAGIPGRLAVVERALSDDSPQVVTEALRSLPPERVSALAGQVIALARRPGHYWSPPRLQALRKLGVAADPRARDLLLAALPEHGMSLGREALTCLVADPDPAISDALIAMLRAQGPRTERGRTVAAFILGERRVRKAAADLAGTLADSFREDGGYQVARACIEALGKIGNGPAAVTALGVVSASSWELRYTGYEDLAVFALRALAHFDDLRVTEIALAAADDAYPDVREQAVRLLAARGDQRAVPRLLMACGGPLAPAALRGLIRLADERAVPTLNRILETSTDRQVLHLAGRALARSARHPVGICPRWYPRSPSLPQLRAYIWARGEHGQAELRDRLPEYLTHPDELVRARTAAALGKIGDPGYAEALAVTLGDISPRVRANAATALGKVATAPGRAGSDRDRAHNWLDRLRHDPHSAVRAAATAALARLGSRS